MRTEIETSDGSLVVPDCQIRAVVRHAERQADLTAATLDAMGLLATKPVTFPAAFLLELAAVLELGMWERQGLRPYLATDLPTYREAAAKLAARANQGSEAFEGSDAAPLSRRVRQVWMERFAWEGHDLLHADVILGEVDEDEFTRVLADFVWQHRRELSKMLNEQEYTS